MWDVDEEAEDEDEADDTLSAEENAWTNGEDWNSRKRNAAVTVTE